MKTILVLASVLFASFSYACPDVSGKYEGVCEEISSCHGPRPVVYHANIKQNQCSDVEMSHIGSPTLIDVFKVDQNTISQNGVSSYLTYSQNDLIRVEKVGLFVSIETLRKIQKNGKDYLDIVYTTRTPNCSVSMSCQIPSL